MNVLKVSNMYPSVSDPLDGIFVRDEILALRSKVSVTILTPRLWVPFFHPKFKPYNEQLPVDDFAKAFRYFSAPAWKLPKIAGKSISRGITSELKNQRPDVLHLHGAFPCSLALPYLELNRISVVVTIHGSDWYKAIRFPGLKKLLLESLSLADAIVTVGDKLKKDIIEVAPKLGKTLYSIAHGIKTEQFPLCTDKKQAKQKAGFDPEKKLLFTAANRLPEKGIDVYLLAIAENKSLRGTTVIIAGKKADQEYEKYLQEIISENKLCNVTFFDTLDREQLITYYHAADVYIQPSRSEGFGLAILEAACTGCPVVATKSGGPEQTVNRVMGLLAEADNRGSLAECIQQILISDDKNPEAIRNEVVKRFSIDECVAKLQDLYTEIVIKNNA